MGGGVGGDGAERCGCGGGCVCVVVEVVVTTDVREVGRSEIG